MNEENLKTNSGRLDITIPEATYEAGKLSIVSILIRNPFDEPIEIIDLQGPKSSQLKEVEINEQTFAGDSDKKNPATSSLFSILKNEVKSGILNMISTEVSIGGIHIPRKHGKVLNIMANENSKVDLQIKVDSFKEINISADKDAIIKLNSSKEENQQKQDSIFIAPHCEVVAYFNVSTTGWLFFTPTRQTLNTQVEYKIGEKIKTQIISSGFDIKPPLKSMVIGSIIGGGLGSLARLLNSSPLPWESQIIVTIGSSIVMSLIAAISLSRKTGSQGFITVEDFFGGFVIGALIGYGGNKYFEETLIPKQA